jgi:hypothetical protein
MTGAFFATVPRDEQCAYCNGERRAATLAPDVQAIYCISLQEQPRRTAQAAAHLHATGLCQQVTFFRPRRGHNANYAIWESHCLVAQEAARRGFDRVIVLEDDVFFYDAWNANVPRIKRAMESLPLTGGVFTSDTCRSRLISSAADCCGRGPAVRTPIWPIGHS